jgi:aminopeptidase N
MKPTAMENWGLITFLENALLYHESVSSVMHKEMIVKVKQI